MKLLCVLFAMLALAAILFSGNLAAWQQQASAKDKENANRVDDPTQKGDRLRQHGFLFLEPDCHDAESHIEFFKTVTGFDVNRRDGNFVILRSERGEIHHSLARRVCFHHSAPIILPKSDRQNDGGRMMSRKGSSDEGVQTTD